MVRVVVAAESRAPRDALTRLFEDAGHEVALAESGDALGTARALAPDLVVLEQPGHGDGPVRRATRLRRECPSAGVLVLAASADTSHALRLVSLGAAGYLLRDRVGDGEEFLAAARRVADGGAALDREVVARLCPADGDGPLAAVTPQERRMLACVAEGLSDVAMARRLCLAQRTVETEVRGALAKLGVPVDSDPRRRVLALLAFMGRQD